MQLRFFLNLDEINRKELKMECNFFFYIYCCNAVFIYKYMCIYILYYIYIERERERVVRISESEIGRTSSAL